MLAHKPRQEGPLALCRSHQMLAQSRSPLQVEARHTGLVGSIDLNSKLPFSPAQVTQRVWLNAEHTAPDPGWPCRSEIDCLQNSRDPIFFSEHVGFAHCSLTVTQFTFAQLECLISLQHSPFFPRTVEQRDFSKVMSGRARI